MSENKKSVNEIVEYINSLVETYREDFQILDKLIFYAEKGEGRYYEELDFFRTEKIVRYETPKGIVEDVERMPSLFSSSNNWLLNLDKIETIYSIISLTRYKDTFERNALNLASEDEILLKRLKNLFKIDNSYTSHIPTKPVEWKKKKSELAMLLKAMYDADMICEQDLEWVTLEKFFTINGKPIKDLRACFDEHSNKYKKFYKAIIDISDILKIMPWSK